MATTPPPPSPLYVQGLKGLAHASFAARLSRNSTQDIADLLHAYRDIDAEPLSSTKFLGIFPTNGWQPQQQPASFFKKIHSSSMWNQSKHLRNLSVQMAPEVITENLNFQTFPDPGHKKYVTPTVLLSITDVPPFNITLCKGLQLEKA